MLASLLLFSAALLPASSRTLDAVVRETMAREHIAGVALAIARSGKLETARAYGYVNLAQRRKATARTVFPIGSITKQFTAAAVMREIHAGRIDPAAPLAAYVPRYAPWSAVTIDSLLHQTSGIASYETFAPASGFSQTSALARAIAQQPLQFAPGTRFDYSNSNALLLGLLLEKLEGRSYGDIVYSWFAGPLELRQTSYLTAATLTTQGYDDAEKPVALEPAGYLFAAAGMTSNALDLVRWEDTLYAGTVLGDADTARFFAPLRLPDASSTGYGMAASVRTMDGRTVFYQTGNVGGYSCIVLHQTDAHLTIALLTNRDRLDLLPLLKSIVRLYDPISEPAR